MRILTCLLLLLLPMQALALSCMKPSVARTYKQANAAAETYVVVEGRLTMDTRKLPKTGGGNFNPPDMTRIPARLTGKSMSSTGFNVPFEKQITLEVACFGMWCGDAQNGMQVLAFVKRHNGRYSLAIDPCGGNVFDNSKKLQHQALQCFNGGACRD